MICSDLRNQIFGKKKKKKNWLPEFGPNGPKSGLELGFLLFSQTAKKFRGPQIGFEIRVFAIFSFLKVASLVFLDIAQDFSLGQCLISNRAETSKKKKKKKMWPK